MTDEGTFPKIAGDIAYASEANRFAFITPLYSSTGSILVNIDANASAALGSFVIYAKSSGLGYITSEYQPLDTGATHQGKGYYSLNINGSNYVFNSYSSTYDAIGNFSDTGLILTSQFPLYSGTVVLSAMCKKNTNAGSVILSNVMVFANNANCSGTL
jgi:hypothetical protein